MQRSTRRLEIRPITVRKNECHVVEMLHRKILDTLLYLRDVHTPPFDACICYSDRTGGENQRQPEPDQDGCHDNDSVRYAHDWPPLQMPWMRLVPVFAGDLPPICFRVASRVPQNGFIGRTLEFRTPDRLSANSVEVPFET